MHVWKIAEKGWIHPFLKNIQKDIAIIIYLPTFQECECE